MRQSVQVALSLKSNTIPNFALHQFRGNTNELRNLSLTKWCYYKMIHFLNSDRQQVQATLDEMVQALVDEFLQPTINQLIPRPE